MATITENRKVVSFTAVELKGYGDITLEQGDHDSLAIEADESLLPRLTSQVRGQRLILGLHWSDWLSWFFRPTGPVHYHIVMQQIDGLAISGAGTLVAKEIQTNRCELYVSGSGTLDIDQLKAQTLRIGISGSGEINLGGTVQRQDIRVSGSGDLAARDLNSQDADIAISGSGNVSVRVQKTLNVHISGMGSIDYIGQPRITQHITGVGQVEQAQAS